MKRTVLLLVLAGGAAAFVLSAACGTLLGITPDDQTEGGAGGGEAGGGGDASGRGDGEVPTPDGFDAVLTPSTISLVAGNAITTDVAVGLTRAPSLPNAPVTVTFETIADLMTAPRADNDPSAPTLHYLLAALPNAAPRRQIITVKVSDGTHTVNRALTLLIAHHYTAHDTATFMVPAPASFAIKAWGAGGAGPSGGAGGYAEATLALGMGSYAVVVGEAGSGAQGGFPGGGNGGAGSTGSGGGGFSGLFLALADGGFTASGAQLVVGGGGGSCINGGVEVGGGGGTTDTLPAEDGAGPLPGLGAHVNAGGAGGGNGAMGETGVMLRGGNAGSNLSGTNQYGGAGGGGYWGGGGGGVDIVNATGCSAGGGGSSFVIAGAKSTITEGARGTTPAKASDGDRVTAGNVGKDGAVIVVPLP